MRRDPYIWHYVNAGVLAALFLAVIAAATMVSNERANGPVGRYDFLSIDREHQVSLAFDTATGEILALPIPGVAK